VVRRTPASFFDVVNPDVLEEAGDSVESEPSSGVRVCQRDAPVADEHTATVRNWD
jgi:hypothetical protein